MTTSAARQARFRAKMATKGLTQVSGWLTTEQAIAVQVLLRTMKDRPELMPGPVRNTLTNKFESFER